MEIGSLRIPMMTTETAGETRGRIVTAPNMVPGETMVDIITMTTTGMIARVIVGEEVRTMGTIRDRIEGNEEEGIVGGDHMGGATTR